MQRRPATIDAGGSDHVTGGHRVTHRHLYGRQEAVRRAEPAAMSHGHRQHLTDRPGERHRPGCDRPDLGSDGGGEIDAPVPAGWVEDRRDRTRHRRRHEEDAGKEEGADLDNVDEVAGCWKT